MPSGRSHSSNRSIFVLTSFLVFLSLLGSPQEASGRSGAEAEMEDLYLSSLDNYDQLRLQEAKQSLQEALRLARRNQLTSPLVAKVYLQLAIIHQVEGEGEEAHRYFVDALKLDPQLQLDPLVSSPSLQAAYEQARLEAGASQGGSGGDTGLFHQPVERAARRTDIPLFVEVPPQLSVGRVVVRYRAQGDGYFRAADLEARGRHGYAGIIPGREVVGRQLAYFVEVMDVAGRVVSGAGSERKPFIVALAEAEERRDPPPEDDPAFWKEPQAVRPKPKTPGQYKRFLFSAQLGSGFGIAKGPPLRKGEEAEIVPGLAWGSAGQLKVEGGVFVSERLLFGLGYRFQAIADAAAGFLVEPMMNAKVRYFVTMDSNWRSFFGGGIGVGSVQHYVDLGPEFDHFKDTTRAGGDASALGPFWGYNSSLEFGGEYIFTDRMSLLFVLDVYALLPNFSIHSDLNVGLSFRF